MEACSKHGYLEAVSSNSNICPSGASSSFHWWNIGQPGLVESFTMPGQVWRAPLQLQGPTSCIWQRGKCTNFNGWSSQPFFRPSLQPITAPETQVTQRRYSATNTTIPARQHGSSCCECPENKSKQSRKNDSRDKKAKLFSPEDLPNHH